MPLPSSFGQIKNRLRPRWIKVLRQSLASRFKLMYVGAQFGAKVVSGNPLKSIKKSDTLFILGSGSSINTLSDTEWASIREADSIGFNFWPIHDHVPSLYVAEVCAVPTGEEANYQRYRDLMALKATAYSNTPILIKDGERVKKQWLAEYVSHFPKSLWPNILLAWDWEIPGDDEESFIAHLQRWETNGLLTGSVAPLVRKRATVSYLIFLALRAGYRKVVLCGIDLDNNDYFYRLRESEYAAKGLPVPQPAVAHAAPIHKTDNIGMGLPISKVLEVIDQRLLKPRNIQLFVALKSSKLYPMLPSYFGH